MEDVRAREKRPGWPLVLVTAFLVALLVAGDVGVAAGSVGRSPFQDVPPGTWPYAVLDYFASRGWVDAPGGDLYVSKRTLTRYEMALLASDVMKRVAERGGWGISRRESEWLQILLKEYEPELRWLGYRLEPAKERSLSLSSTHLSAAHGFSNHRLREAGEQAQVGSTGASSFQLVGWPSGAESVRWAGRGPAAYGASVAAWLGGVEKRAWAFRAAMGDFALSATANGHIRRSIGSIIRREKVNGETPFSLAAADTRRNWTLEVRREEGGGSAGGVRFGARATFRVVERAMAEWVKPGFPSPDRWDEEARELRSYDLILDLGDIRVTSFPTSLRRGLQPWQERGSLGPVSFSAGVSSVSPGMQGANWGLREEPRDLQTTTASRAGLGIDLFIPSARLRLGWQYEGELDGRFGRGGGRTTAGMEYQIDARAQALAGIVLSDENEGTTTRTTQLGLRYALGRDSSLLLGYRLIDFGKLRDETRDDPLTKMATAEFSTRF